MTFGTGLRLVVVALLLALPLPAAAAGRVAFLVGNAIYDHSAPLANPGRDVQLIAETLRSVDFTVAVFENLTRDEIGRELNTFLRANADADVTLFYFAGHGMQYEGKNYLVGVDAALESEFDIESEALDLDRIIQMLERSSRASLVFIDACRDNPLAKRFYTENFSATRALAAQGLAPLQDTYQGSMITFSAAPGEVAYDGADYSPFAQALAKHLPTETVEVLSLMKRVIGDVKIATADKQTPVVTNDLTQEIYLKLGEDGAGSDILLAQEQAMFDAAMSLQSERGWTIFLERFPNGLLRDMAMLERERLQVTAMAEASGLAATPAIPGERIAITQDVALETERSLGLSDEDAKAVQQALNDRGYPAGGVDGKFGTRTRQAIADFQAAVQLPSTGVVTEATAAALGVTLQRAETSASAVTSSRNARQYDPEELALVESDPRLFKAAKALGEREFTYGFYEGRLYLAVLNWYGSWEEVNQLAANAGGHLASITSSEENEFIFELIRYDDRMWQLLDDKHGTMGPTFGMHQIEGSREPDGGWVWLTGEPTVFENWLQNDPNNNDGTDFIAGYQQESPWGTVLEEPLPASTWADGSMPNRAFIMEVE